MELQIKNEKIDYIQCIRTGILTDTQTAELIVPDTMPDAEFIADASCVCYLKSKDCTVGGAVLTGMATGAVIVSAGGTLRRLDVNIPVSMRYENGCITPECKIAARLHIQNVDARIIHSRKIAVTVTASGESFIFTPSELTIPTEVIGDVPCRLRKKPLMLSTVTAAGERQYVISDELRIPDDKKPMEEILYSDTRIVTDDVKVVGTKAIINCTSQTDIIYASEDGELNTLRRDTRYTQIVEMENNADDCEVCAVSVLTGVYMNSDLLASSDERRCAIELHIVTQCFAVKQTETELLSDLYSPAYELDIRRAETCVSTVAPMVKASDSFRVSIDAEDARRVLNCAVHADSVSAESGKLTVSGTVKARLQTADGSLHLVSALFRNEVASASCASADALYLQPHFLTDASVSGSGIEIRVNAEYEVWSLDERHIDAITGVVFDENRKTELRNRPSFVIRQVSEEDDIWTLSKKYCSDENAILTANGAADEAELLSKTFILIPKNAL